MQTLQIKNIDAALSSRVFHLNWHYLTHSKTVMQVMIPTTLPSRWKMTINSVRNVLNGP